jgi:predicted Na+-dependent transporter
MQSSSLALMLATRHLGAGGLAAVPCALSVSCMLLWGMSLASLLVWKDERNAKQLATPGANPGVAPSGA